MNRVSALFAVGCLLWSGPALAQGGEFAQPEAEPPPGDVQAQDFDVWAIDVRAAFPDGLPIGGDEPLQELYVYRRGLVSLSGLLPEPLIAQPRTLLDVDRARLIAPFWADLDVTGCRTARGQNEVYVSTEPGLLQVTWHEVVPAGCPALVRPATFALRIGPVADGVVHLAFEYLAAGSPEVFHPRAGLVLDGVIELFREPAQGESFAVPRDRAKALFDGGSHDEQGVWRFELAAGGGGLIGDRDSDGVRDEFDNCRRDVNPLQLDQDGDEEGNACDLDDDGDRVRDIADNCPLVANADQHDVDRDGQGDPCDSDRDGDLIGNRFDNCPDDFQAVPFDLDGDGLGDACDPDIDGDDDAAGRASGFVPPDSCPGVFDASRKDQDGDGLGDACDLVPRWPCTAERCPTHTDWDGDGVDDTVDLCPRWADAQQDSDKDGIGDACDRDEFMPMRRQRVTPLQINPPRLPLDLPR